ncbi:NAD-dependent epimerase/dehydratase [Haladaptatus paucihalophilus DX253]|uniref:NAD-dependent epimerase/dehydratase n=1 Tax=Haladaptatus paucihalophilus DX253 TaxID=797209 RepID=E7QVL2_HALPU|nr:NAD(P)-dependent oxidoreductase [Haladaptatus paucihalophilus]EFW91275.1 NAD-dependent epimerase/dehydratase [Haladaptatus paucihalophilus DX253]SHL09426.1 UDP-glucose 4-epimerase [Haladaptatus paucihalophilus DX253]
MSDTDASAGTPTVSVTGAGGYVGSCVVNVIREHHPEWEIRAFDNFYRGEIHRIGDIDVEFLDVRRRDRLESALDGSDVVLHLAAASDVDSCRDDEEFALETNVHGTTNVAWFCKRTGAGLAFPFSMAVLGDPEEFPITVDASRRPMNWYGETKLVGERTIESLAADAFPAHLFLKANVYGEHTVNDRGISRGMVLEFFVRRAFADEPISVYEPGTQARNFVHVRDVADAYRRSAERLVDRCDAGRTGVSKYEIASDEEWTVMELAELVQRTVADEVGREPDIEVVENPRGDETLVTDFDVDISAARRELGWQPDRSIRASVERLVRRRAEG